MFLHPEAAIIFELNESEDFVEWFTLGIYLKFKAYELEEIEVNHKYDPEECTVRMIIKWCRKEEPSWKKLVDALCAMGMDKLACRIARKYSKAILNHNV